MVVLQSFAFLILVIGSVANASESDYASITFPIPRGMSKVEYTRSIVDYWTPERMVGAQSKDVEVSSFPFRYERVANSSNDTKYSTPIALPSISNDTTRLFQSTGTFNPPSTVGKVYFVMNGKDYMCSASTIYSTNRDTVITAGHCVYDEKLKMWATKITFKPRYSNGAEPLGSWTARRFATFNGWMKSGDFNFDVAVVLMYTNSRNQHIQDVTGALAMTANWPRAATVNAFGYPGAISNGQVMSKCTSSSSASTYISGFSGLKLPCGLTQGASGGPWIQNFNPTTLLGSQTSVNSFISSGYPGYMFGPYFNTDVWNMYKTYENM